MNDHPIRTTDWLPLLLILWLLMLGIGLLSGCAGPSQQSGTTDSTTVSTFTPDGEGLPNATQILLRKQAADVQLTQYWAGVATEVALSPRPTEPDGPIYLESPIPTPTWAVGYGDGILPANTFFPEYNSCWYGYLNDKLLSVCAGHEQQGGDPEQGVIQVKVIEQDQVDVISNDVYETPEKVGVVHIVTADSNSATVASEDRQHVYTFDIATRQWVSLTPQPYTPQPSPSVTIPQIQSPTAISTP